MAYADNNRLAQVKLRASGGDTVVGDYSYDGKGQRATKTSGGVTSHFVYGPNGELIGEYKSTGELVSEFIYLNGQPVAVYAAQTETLPPTPPIDLIVDNDAAGTSSTGSWAVKTNANDYGANYREGDSTDTYRWTPSPISGTFEVYAWWVANSKYSKVANYTISHTGASDVVVKSHAANGGAWQLLGTYVLNGSGTEYVQLHAADGKKIGADAIRFKQLGGGSVTVTTVGTYFIHTDHLGTPRRVSNDVQTVIWRWDSRPFGDSVPNEDPDGNAKPFVLNLRFPGQYFDPESALNYNYFRDYDPGTGRYVESDPAGLGGGINTYVYVEDNPLSYSDPLGLNPAVGCLAGAWAGPIGCGVGAGIGTAIMGGVALAAILSTPGDTARTNEKDQCRDDDGDDCKEKASDWELKQAGIDAHEVKKGLGQVSLFEICKCKSGGFAVKRKGCQGPIIFRL